MDELGSSVAENTVAYRGFVLPASGDPPHRRLGQAELIGFRNECLNAIGHRLAGYIWQEEAFNLNVVDKGENCGKRAVMGLFTLSFIHSLIHTHYRKGQITSNSHKFVKSIKEFGIP